MRKTVVMLAFGTMIAPMVLAFILAPMLEQSLTQSLIMSHGNPAVFFTRPIAAAFMILTVVSVFFYARSMMRARKRGTAPPFPGAGETS